MIGGCNITGYPFVGLLREQKKPGNGYYKDRVTYKVVHVLVALIWVNNPDNKPFVNHKNGIKFDPFYGNLEWMTQQENSNHAVETGLKPYINRMKDLLNSLEVGQTINVPKTTQASIQNSLNIIFKKENKKFKIILINFEIGESIIKRIS